MPCSMVTNSVTQLLNLAHGDHPALRRVGFEVSTAFACEFRQSGGLEIIPVVEDKCAVLFVEGIFQADLFGDMNVRSLIGRK